MKIAIWNCMNGLGNPMQINCFNDLNVDLAIFPELKQKTLSSYNRLTQLGLRLHIPAGAGVDPSSLVPLHLRRNMRTGA
jgi:hypothetical protein